MSNNRESWLQKSLAVGFRTAVALVVFAAAMVGPSNSADAATEPGRPALVFEDVAEDSPYAQAVAWLAESWITRGCNPPANTRFCPDQPVTRGQMAAFLHRALPDLEAAAPALTFSDTAGSVFEGDIAWLARTGITRGCDPPANTRFCPDQPITRGQMAAMLVRAFDYSGPGDHDFVDDDESVFEADIERLAGAGVTLGCNPPANDRFCPDATVTRVQMAAFLNRSFGSPTPWMRLEVDVDEYTMGNWISDEGLVLVFDDIGEMYIWDPFAGTLEGTPTDPYFGVRISQGGLIAGSTNVWDPSTDELRTTPERPSGVRAWEPYLRAINDSGQGAGIYLDLDSTTAYHGIVWDYDDPEVTVLEEPADRYSYPASLNDTGVLAGVHTSTDLDRTVDPEIILWDADDGSFLDSEPIPGAGDDLRVLTINDANEVLATIDPGGAALQTLVLWDSGSDALRTLTAARLADELDDLLGSDVGIDRIDGALAEDGTVVLFVLFDDNTNGAGLVWNTRTDTIGPSVLDLWSYGTSTPDRKVFVGRAAEGPAPDSARWVEFAVWDVRDVPVTTRFRTDAGDSPASITSSGMISGSGQSRVTGEHVAVVWLPPSGWPE